MPEYLVTWQIELDADSPREAAERARAIQLDPDAWVGAFEVQEQPEMAKGASTAAPVVRVDIDPDGTLTEGAAR